MVVVVGGAASSGGAEVDPNGPPGPAVWAASCLSPGTRELVVYGRGWTAAAVALTVTDQAGAVVGSASPAATARSGGAAFQARVALSVSDTTVLLHLGAAQGKSRTAAQDVIVAPACSPTISAAISGTPCALPGRTAVVAVTVQGAPTSIFYALVHHVDLYGPAEVVDRAQPARPIGEYTLSISVPNVPDRQVPVTVEARRADGSFAYATTNVALPPACAATTTVPPTGPTSTPPTTTTGATGTTTAPPPSAGSTVPGLPSLVTPGRPGSGGGATLSLSPALGRAGEVTSVAGRGFAPSQPLTLRWRPGTGSWTITAGADGTFRTQVLVLPNDVEGPRALEVAGARPAPFLVVPSSEQPAFGGVFVRS